MRASTLLCGLPLPAEDGVSDLGSLEIHAGAKGFGLATALSFKEVQALLGPHAQRTSSFSGSRLTDAMTLNSGALGKLDFVVCQAGAQVCSANLRGSSVDGICPASQQGAAADYLEGVRISDGTATEQRCCHCTHQNAGGAPQKVSAPGKVGSQSSRTCCSRCCSNLQSEAANRVHACPLVAFSDVARVTVRLPCHMAVLPCTAHLLTQPHT